ncbi:hypothetical protein U3516DRAFT_740317 [Neocallimastix sp. 'constans']
MKKEYEKLSNKLKNSDNLNKEEINNLIIEFDKFKKFMDNKINEDKILQKQEIERQIKQIKHGDLRDRMPNKFREKSKLDYTYNTIDFEESYGTYKNFIQSLQKDNMSDEEYFSAITGKTYKPNENLKNQVIPKEPQSISQWYFIKENNEEERINKHQQVVVFSPDEFEAIKDPSNMICPKYRGKSTGYDDLRDFNTSLVRKKKPKKWYKKEKKDVLNKLRDNPRLKGVLMWYEFNKIISKFEYKFCEFTQSEQENYWNNIKPIQSLNSDNLKKLVQQIEKVAVNLNKEYGEMVIKLISRIQDPKYINYLQKNMCRLPVTNKSIDLITRNNINKTIYLDTLRILHTKLQENEGNNSIKKKFNDLFNCNNKKNTEVNNIEDSSSKNFIPSKPINNPKWNSRYKFNFKINNMNSKDDNSSNTDGVPKVDLQKQHWKINNKILEKSFKTDFLEKIQKELTRTMKMKYSKIVQVMARSLTAIPRFPFTNCLRIKSPIYINLISNLGKLFLSRKRLEEKIR